jgi:hypothetical protein
MLDFTVIWLQLQYLQAVFLSLPEITLLKVFKGKANFVADIHFLS